MCVARATRSSPWRTTTRLTTPCTGTNIHTHTHTKPCVSELTEVVEKFCSCTVFAAQPNVSKLTCAFLQSAALCSRRLSDAAHGQLQRAAVRRRWTRGRDRSVPQPQQFRSVVLGAKLVILLRAWQGKNGKKKFTQCPCFYFVAKNVILAGVKVGVRNLNIVEI